MSGRTELDETLHIQHPFKGTKPFPEPEEWERGKKKKRTKKKLKWLTAQRLPQKGLIQYYISQGAGTSLQHSAKHC